MAEKQRRYWLHEMTRPAFEEYLKSEPKPVALIPLGSVEQHGPHLPLGTDLLGALNVTELTARKANAFGVFCTLPAYSPHHMGFKGTITLRPETLSAYLTDVIGSLAHHGIKRVMLINTHGGNEEIISVVAKTAGREFGVIVAKPRSRVFVISPELIASLDIHSGKTETAEMLAVAPQLVEMDRVKNHRPTENIPADVAALLDAKRPDAFLAQQVAYLHLGDTHTHTSSGVYGFTLPQDGRAEEGHQFEEALSDEYAEFIRLWRTVTIPGEGTTAR